MAEQRAQMAETEAKRERAEAELGEQRAHMHEQGMADDELIEDHERDKFAGTSAVQQDDPAPMRDDDRPMHEPDSEYEQGREDEARTRESRFGRDDETARTDEPTTTQRRD